MNKINHFVEYSEENDIQYNEIEEESIQPTKKVGITYDDIMLRLTNQLIYPTQQYIAPINNYNTENYTKPPTASVKSVKVDNNSRMPGYVKPFPATNGEYKSSQINMRVVPNTTPSTPVLNTENVSRLSSVNKLELLRKINLHNAHIAKMKSASSSKMTFQ
jgi:hypothetical protein